ncbi:MAG: undecaprenyl/decaprenyl-phosphate alpha-N-acetylglucosaminyl 1-phosphate transferase [Patescibacteria group bacterium]|nr:undecaprenyl/decaprenyl-phosphate alpha-N-acetylglucosaminyl 1-phosphate transferase [Patescibacteria group bacterium]
MQEVVVALVAFLITAGSIPLTIKLAKHYGLVDNPQKRDHPAHVQGRIIPRAGGLPIFVGVLISALLFLPIEKHLVGIFLGMSVLLAVGLIDDKIREFSPYWRLGLLLIAALCAVAAGIGISFISNPLYQITNPLLDPTQSIIHLDSLIIPFNLLGAHKIILIADLLALLWIMTLTQVINWAKGVDGQMPGITLVAAITLGLFSLKLFYEGDPNQLNIAKLSLITAGASLGLLVFNWHPSKILPGFSGSTILAYLLAVLSILAGAKLATAMLVLAIPIIDFAYTFFRRVLNGRSPVWGDRGHFHHRLLDLGWSHQQISLFYILGSAILGSIALFVDTSSKIFIILGLAVVFCLFILWLNSFSQRKTN